ncbi:MAG: glycosyltransferase [Microthrixaceae bacterium]|nr:glycosyltransferase [Microthrixaceae bacterium]
MRILVVAEQYPWPAADGYRRRLDHMVKGLAKLGQVDVVALHRPGTADPQDPGIPSVKANAVPVGPDAGLRKWFKTWVRSRFPRRVLGVDWTPAVEEISTVSSPGAPYDLVWYSHVDSWVGLERHIHARSAIVDFDNLENIALRLRRKVPPRFAPGASPLSKVKVIARWLTSRAFDLVDERRWAKLQIRCAESVDKVVVCSDLDVGRSGCPNAVAVGNGADRPEAVHTDRLSLRSGTPTMLFVGALDYEPNTEAMEWFVRDVFPAIRAQVPDASVRIVGRGSDLIAWTSEVDGVELVGSVPSIESELLNADVSIVPIQVGAGTRLKVVEALANYIPMVTTTVGCEGIDLVDGTHGLIRDDAHSFAQACASLLTDGELRHELAIGGAALFEERYDWALIESRVADLARSVIDTAC